MIISQCFDVAADREDSYYAAESIVSIALRIRQIVVPASSHGCIPFCHGRACRSRNWTSRL
jgi:hypothetical protein